MRACQACGLLGGAALLMAMPPRLPAQTPERCRVQLVGVGDSLVMSTSATGRDYFAGGGVRLRCRGQEIAMQSDSAAAYASGDVEFIGHMRYRDSTLDIAADRATYRKAREAWEARGNVVARNLSTGSTIQGPSIDYLRAAAGARDTFEMFATGRPRVQYFEGDSTGANREPYRIVADRLHLRGNNLIWAGGNVRVDRSDLAATADSMRLDTGAGNDGMLLGRPVFRGLGGDSFTVAGRRIDFALHRREVTHVTATDSARATHGEWTLTADTISMDVASRKVTAMLAWGRQSRPHAVSARHELRADSLAFDLPDQALKQVRAFGDAWVGGPPDSTGHDRDWLAGDTVIADFVQRDSAGSKRSVLGGLVARHGARSFHRVAAKERGTAPSLAYVRGDAITIVMRADSAEAVDRVEVRGHVDGAQLDPGTPSSPAGSAPSPGGAPARPPRSPGAGS